MLTKKLTKIKSFHGFFGPQRHIIFTRVDPSRKVFTNQPPKRPPEWDAGGDLELPASFPWGGWRFKKSNWKEGLFHISNSLIFFIYVEFEGLSSLYVSYSCITWVLIVFYLWQHFFFWKCCRKILWWWPPFQSSIVALQPMRSFFKEEPWISSKSLASSEQWSKAMVI